MSNEEYSVDPARFHMPETGIYVRAKLKDKYGSFDVSRLTKESLLGWLRSRGGHNEWAENVVGILLGHGPLTGETHG